MNTNLKIALLLGYSFTRHGWMPEVGDDDFAFKVMDDMDYNFFAFNDAQSLVQAMNDIEKKYHMEFEFQRTDGVYKLLKVHRLNPYDEGKEVIEDPNFVTFLRKVIEQSFTDESITKKIAKVKEEYPWHYNGLKEATGDYL